MPALWLGVNLCLSQAARLRDCLMQSSAARKIKGAPFRAPLINNGSRFILSKGMTYVVSDELSSHRSVAENGVKLLIIDGEFLQQTIE